MSSLTDYVVGPMPFNAFMNNFMEPCSASVVSRKGVSKQTFRKIPLQQSPEKMQEALARTINENGLCPGVVFKPIVSQQADKRCQADITPPLGCFQDVEDDEGLPAWHRLQFFADVSPNDNHDPFIEFFKDSKRDYVIRGKEVDVDTKEMHKRLVRNLTRQFTHQHRTFTFVVVMFGRFARVLRVDRAGIIVSSTINYVANPSLLAKFLWRFSSLSLEERGFDPCAQPVTPHEKALLAEAIHQYMRLVDSGKARLLPGMSRTLARDVPAYRVTVTQESTGDNTDYIIQQSFTPERNFFGRATRGFVALNLRDLPLYDSDPDALAKCLVFLKDSWLVSEEGAQTEGDIYMDLRECGIAHIPEVFAAGCVYSDAEAYRTDNSQITVTNDWAYKPHRWRRTLRCCPRLYLHYRVVQELLFPLSTVPHAKELVQVIRDALQCVIEVYAKARRLHRDISYSNIMITVSGDGRARGVLTDWDISRQLSEGSTLRHRAGTWQFMSVNLLRRPDHVHELHDDLESALWVLLYAAMRHFEHTSDFGLYIFDDKSTHPGSGIVIGGGAKLAFLRLFTGHFKCPALNTIILSLLRFWDDYYHIKDPEERRARHDSIQENPTEILQLFDDALASPDELWVHGAAIPEQRRTSMFGNLHVSTPSSQSSKEESVGSAQNMQKRRRPSTSVSENARSRRRKA
ncbi:hypothetical protein K474DRAFT_1666380 [Panus rudis PR-1116 ss-1]|nr:hypothetical protein K474DRAFT_1666380 [Panus rudis PR-1116 ss-1]